LIFKYLTGDFHTLSQVYLVVIVAHGFSVALLYGVIIVV